MKSREISNDDDSDDDDRLFFVTMDTVMISLSNYL
jgi:hypothetical protein